MSTRNGRSRKLTTVPKLENTEPINETDGSAENPPQNEEVNKAIESATSLDSASSAIAHPVEQTANDSPDALQAQDEVSGLDSASSAIAHPEEQPPGDSPDAQPATDEASGLDSTIGAIASPQEQTAKDSPDAEDKTESLANDQQAAQPSPEEVLRAAKAASQKAQESEPEPSSSEAPQSSGAIEKTVSSELQQATNDAAKELVDANSQALQERVQIGVREGLEDAKDIRKGYQLGLLKGLTQAKQTDTRELGEQLQALRSHTDTQAQSDVSESLTQLNKTVKKEDLEESPLELVNRLVKESAPTQNEGFRIL